MNDDKKEAVWTIDLKKNGAILKGLASPKADVTLIMSDDTFSQLAAGKVCIIVVHSDVNH